MKNLKKVLALVLVVAMMASFAVSAGAASFTDNDKIVYNDAVKLLSNLDVINGFTDGSFNPEGNVTRAQTAKMIAYIMNGGEDASSTFAASVKFNDVANGYWAANSIGYCATKEIVAGAGNNLYYPNNDVTGVQLAKMALVALGYDPTIEKLTGSAWAINTINLAEDAGLFDDMNKDFNASAAASRQEAAQILYNMLLSEMVCYTDNGTNIIIGDITINTDATRKYMDKDGKAVDDKDDAILGVEEYFSLTGNGNVQTGTDDYGRPARVIDVKGVDSITIADSADLKYDGQVTAGTLYSDLGNDVRDYKQIVYIDGANVYDESGKNTTGDSKYEMVIEKNNSDDKNGYKGATMEAFIDDDAETVTFVIIKTYLAQVDSIDENKDDKDLLDIDFNVFGGSDVTLDEQESFGYEEDDYVLVTLGKDGKEDVIDVIGTPETIEGTAARIATDAYTIDGTKYNFSETYKDADAQNAVGNDNTGTYTFYLDKQGYVIGTTEIEAGAAAGNYLYVTTAKSKNDGFDYELKAKATLTDGTEATIYLPTREKNGKYEFKNPNGDWVELKKDATDQLATGWYSYTKSGDTYTLKNISSGYVVTSNSLAVADLLSGNAGIGKIDGKSYVANSSTKLYMVESDVTYTGYKNFPDADKVDATDVPVLIILTSRNGKTASEIYVLKDGGTSSSVTVAMYTGTSSSGSDGDYANFYVGGEEVEYLLGTAPTLAKKAIYKLDGNDKDGYDVTLMEGTNYDDKNNPAEGKYIVFNGRVTSNSTGDYFYMDEKIGDYTDAANDDTIAKETLFYYGYDEDDVEMEIYDGSNGSADKLSKNDIVKVLCIQVDGEYYALAAYVMD